MEKMSAEEIVRRLIQGSHAIDRMRTEVREVIRMLIGYISHCDGWDSSFPKEFANDSCRWIVSKNPFSRVDSKLDKIQIECRVRLNGCKCESLALSSQPDYIPFYTENVKCVYENLGVLVGGLTKTLPELEEKWKPLIDASYVFEK